MMRLWVLAMTVEEYLHKKYNYINDTGDIPLSFIFEETLLDDNGTIRRKIAAIYGRRRCPEMFSKNDFVKVCILLIGCI